MLFAVVFLDEPPFHAIAFAIATPLTPILRLLRFLQLPVFRQIRLFSSLCFRYDNISPRDIVFFLIRAKRAAHFASWPAVSA
jgi:hypothetical protein